MGQTELHSAIYNGDLLAVKKFLDSGLNIEARNRQNDTPLHLAALKGHGSIMEILLEKEAKTDSRNNNGETPLHVAASYGKALTIGILLRAGADPNAKSKDNNSPLHLAARRGHASVIEPLLKKGALIGAINYNCETPLHIAASYGKESAVGTLLGMGANPYAKNKDGDLPLHLAVNSGSVDVTERFLNNGVDLNIQNDNKHTALHLATIKGDIPLIKVLTNSRDDVGLYNLNFSGNTGAHHAAYNGKCETVKLLLEIGFDINYKNIKFNTLLHHAVFQGHVELISLLLENRANLEVKNLSEETPLHTAILNGNIPIIKILIDAGASMCNFNRSGNTGAHHAAFNGNIKILEVLLDHGFDVDLQNTKGNTLLHLAAREGHIDAVRLLISKGADPSVFSSSGNSPANLAARLGYTNIVSELLQSGAVPSNSKDGWSILHSAAFGNRLHTIQTLVTNFPNKIDLNATWKGRSAQVYANIIGSSDSAWWLRKQLKNDLNTETCAISSLDYCKEHYEKSGVDTIKRCEKHCKRETEWIRKSILDGQIDMHYMDEEGNTMLHIAAENKNKLTIEILVDAGALIVARNFRDGTPHSIMKINTESLNNHSDVEPNSLLDGRIASHLYTVLLNMVAQTVCLEDRDNRDQEPCVAEKENVDKKVQKMKLEAIKIVSKLLTQGVPHDPLGSCHRYLLPLAITTNNRTLLLILLAAGLPLTTADSGLSIVQLAWLTPDLTTWVGMIITRAVIHQLQFEQKHIPVDECSATRFNDILRDRINVLVQDLSGATPWKAQFQCQNDVTLTQLYVTACRYGATVAAWYIWKAGASNIDRVSPYNCTALEGALSEKHFSTAIRLVLDMDSNPFMKGTEDEVPLNVFPENMRLLEIMLGQDFRSLDKMVEKVKDEHDKRDYQQIILLLIVLFIQYNSGKSMNRWKSFLHLVLKAYSQIAVKETSYASSNWMVMLECILVEDGVEGIKFKPIENVSAKIRDIYNDVGLSNSLKKYAFDDTTDHFYSLLYTLHHNFFCLEIFEIGGLKRDSKQEFLFQKALKTSCEKHYPLFLHLLISLANLNVESTLNDVCKTRPLHHAAGNGNSSAVDYLLQCGASPSQKDHSGILPVDYAFMYGHISTGDILSKHMQDGNDEIDMDKSMSPYLEAHQAYLRLYGLDPECNGKSRYLHLDNYENLLKNHLDYIKKEWEHKGMKRAVEEILVDYGSGEAQEVKESVTKLLTSLKEKICQKDPLFEGDIEFVGSSEDNVRLYCPDEYDCNLLLRNVSAFPNGELKSTLVKLEKQKADLSGHSQSLEVSPIKEELKNVMKGSNLLTTFYHTAKRSLIEMDLGEGQLKIMMPGIRRTQVGIALCFLWQGTKYPMLFVDIDFVPTMKAPWPENLLVPECSLDRCHLEKVYLNNVGEDEWRLSFGLAETEIMKNLSNDRRAVFLACKMILAALKTEGWVPHKLKCKFMYWCSRMFSLPSKGGFALKNCFFRELQEISEDKDWTSDKILKRVRSVFRRMCELGEPALAGIDKLSKAPIEGPKPVKAYFGGDTEKASIYLCAPEILKFLRSLDSSVIG